MRLIVGPSCCSRFCDIDIFIQWRDIRTSNIGQAFGESFNILSMRSVIVAFLPLTAVTAMPLFERDGEGQETCDIIEYQGHISLWDGTQPVCLTVASENVENGSLVSV